MIPYTSSSVVLIVVKRIAIIKVARINGASTESLDPYNLWVTPRAIQTDCVINPKSVSN